MPRKRRGGSRGSSPEKQVQGVGNANGRPPQYGKSGPNFPPPAGSWSQPPPPAPSPARDNNDQEQIFQHVQDMFQGKIEADVVYMVLNESEWKVDDALEKLFMLTTSGDSEQGPSLRTVSQALHYPTTSGTFMDTRSGYMDHPAPQAPMGYLEQLQPEPGDYMEDPANYFPPAMGHQGSRPLQEHMAQMSLNQPVLGPPTRPIPVPEGEQSSRPSLNVNLRSRLPSQQSPLDSLPVLSPKTPHIVQTDFSELLGNYESNDNSSAVGNHSVQCAMQALDSYASSTNFVAPGISEGTSPQDMYGNVYSGIFNINDPGGPTAHGLSMGGEGDNGQAASKVASSVMAGFQSPVTQPQVYGVNYPGTLHPIMEAASSGGERNTLSPTSPAYYVSSPEQAPNNKISLGYTQDNKPVTPFPEIPEAKDAFVTSPSQPEPRYNPGSKVPIPIKPKGTRKKTLSLNPEEREALENLIEDVIIGGVDEGIIDSDSSDTDSDSAKNQEAANQQADGSKQGKEGMPKIYPAQLKVAVKHMKQLPPRFMRRLHNAQKRIEAAARLEAEKEREEFETREREREEREVLAANREKERMKTKEVQLKKKKKVPTATLR